MSDITPDTGDPGNRILCADVIVVASPKLLTGLDASLLIESIHTFLSTGDKSLTFYVNKTDEQALLKLGSLMASSLPTLKIVTFDSARPELVLTALREVKLSTPENEHNQWRAVLITDLVVVLPSTPEDLLVFFVGSKQELSCKYRNTIPLIEHGGSGLVNVLHYLAQVPGPFSAGHSDIITFISKSRGYYTRPEVGVHAMSRALRAAEDLQKAFPEITGIYGGGFPFTVVRNDDIEDLDAVPPSILRYFDEQSRYFSAHLVDSLTFDKCKNERLEIAQAEMQLRVELHRSSYDEWQFIKYGRTLPPVPQNGSTLFSYYQANCFEVSNTVWPCIHCASLNNYGVVKTKTPERNFDDDCLACRQTMFLLRNVMACANDTDVVVTTETDALYMAEKIQDFLRSHVEWYAYDTNFARVMEETKGPLDVFVVNQTEFWDTLESKVAAADIEARMSSFVVWLPICSHRLKIGANFALGFEPLFVKKQQDLTRLRNIRHNFAIHCNVTNYVERLRFFSVYHKQLLSNEGILGNLNEKVARWRQFAV